MSPDQIWSSYIRPIGAGAVAMAGLITLVRTLPTIVSALTAGLKDVRAQRAGNAPQAGRQERDLPVKFVLAGSVVLLVMIWAFLTFKPIPGAATGLFSNLAAALLVMVFGFLFVTVSCRICGLIGTSSNPVSGMTIATLMATCAMFLVTGWTGGAYAALAITIGGVVAIAAANAGATSQDLKTGYLVGATPVRQQIGLIVGVLVASFFIGLTLIGMNKGLEKFTPNVIPINLAQLPDGVQVESQNYEHAGKTYVLVNALGSQEVPDGKYLYDSATRQIPDAAAAVAAGAARCVSRGGHRIVGREIVVLCRGIVSLDCHHHGNFCWWSGALARRTQPVQNRRRGKRSQPRFALFQRLDCRGRRGGSAGNHHQAHGNPGLGDARQVQRRHAMDRQPGNKWLARCGNVPAAGVVVIHICPQEARVAGPCGIEFIELRTHVTTPGHSLASAMLESFA